MSVRWLIEALREEDAARLAEAVVQEGGTTSRWEDEWWETRRFPSFRGVGAVLFHGSLGTADRIRREGRWRPGAWCDTEALHYSRWAPRVPDLLVNRRWRRTTVRELVAAPPSGEPIFVRPDSPLKPFSGRVLPAGAVTPAALDHGYYYEDDALPVIVAPAVEVGSEWRLVVVDGEVVAGSGYIAEGRQATGDEDIPSEVRALADGVVGRVEVPDPVFVVDVALVAGESRLVELNPFSGADLYACDRRAIVRAIHGLLARSG